MKNSKYNKNAIVSFILSVPLLMSILVLRASESMAVSIGSFGRSFIQLFFITSIVSFFIALIFGINSISKIKKSGEKGKGFALTPIFISCLIVLWFIFQSTLGGGIIPWNGTPDNWYTRFTGQYHDPKDQEKAPENQIVDRRLGNKEDLISFSILTGSKVHGLLQYQGVIKGNYFFEANIRINILDMNKKPLKQSNAMATDDWMNAGPVSFEGKIDFTGLPNGPAYFEIQNDNPSGDQTRDKSILIPIVIDNKIVAVPVQNTYTYKNHGFTIELPKGYVPHEEQAEGGPSIGIDLPGGFLNYITNATWWDEHNMTDMTYIKDEKIGTTTFKVYKYDSGLDINTFYIFRQGNVEYQYNGGDIEILKTFKFVGWQ